LRRAERNTTILGALFEKPRTILEIIEATGIPRTSVQRRILELERLGRVRHHPDHKYSPADPDRDSEGAIERRAEWDNRLSSIFFSRDQWQQIVERNLHRRLRPKDLARHFPRREARILLRELREDSTTVITKRKFAAP